MEEYTSTKKEFTLGNAVCQITVSFSQDSWRNPLKNFQDQE